MLLCADAVDEADASRVANDDWHDSQPAVIQATGVPPSNSLESAIVTTLANGSYTAIVSGYHDATGVGLVEVYNLQ